MRVTWWAEEEDVIDVIGATLRERFLVVRFKTAHQITTCPTAVMLLLHGLVRRLNR